MGRGQRANNEAIATLAPSSDLRRAAPPAGERRLLMGRLIRRARMGGALSSDDQRHLVILVQQATAGDDLQAARDGRDALVASNMGWIKTFVNQHKGLGIDDDTMIQAAQVGMNRAVDSYDPDEGAGFLHYSTMWMRAELTEAAESEAHTIRLKSKAFRTNYRIRKLLREFADRGEKQPTVQQLTDALNAQGGTPLRPEQVADVLPYAQRAIASLDEGFVDGYGRTFSSLHNVIDGDERTVSRKRDRHAGGAFRYLVADPRSEQEIGLLARFDRDQVLAAVSRLPDPVGRRVFELTYGLDGSDDDVQQKDMFAGVYRDAKGATFSAEDAIIAAHGEQGEPVTKASQKTLDARLHAGELTFHADTPVAAELHRLGGVPATSGTVQYALARAQRQIRNELEEAAQTVRYRGPDELERSEAAREAVRRTLVARGLVPSAAAAAKLKTGRPGRDGVVRSKGTLRVLAEEHGLVDDQGRVAQGPLEGPVVTPRASVPRPTTQRPAAPLIRRSAPVPKTEPQPPAAAKAATAKPGKATGKAKAPAQAKATSETLHCQEGDHTWTRALVRGAKPKSCPDHRTPAASLSATELAARQPTPPAKPKASTAKASTAKASTAKATAAPGAAQTLWCAVGAHEWTRQTALGRPPVSCPDHRRPLASLDRGELDRLEELREQARQARALADQATQVAQVAQRAAKRAADAVAAAQVASGAPAVKAVWCVAGQHEWEREVGPGRPPMHCPEHRPAAKNRPAAASAG